MPYDFHIQGQMSLETRQAYQAGLQLNQDLNRLMSETSINLNTDNLSAANKQVLELQSNLRAALNPSRGTIDLAMLKQQLDRSGTSLQSYAATLSKYGKDGQQAFLSLTKQIAAAEAPTTRLSQGLKNAGEQFKRTIGWQLSSSAIHGVMSTYSQAIGYAKELNRSLTDIRIVTGQSQAQMAQFAKTANVAAKNLSSTTTRYTDAALIYYQQGLSDKAVKERTDVTIKMANVAGVSAEKASQQLTSIWNNFDNGSKSLEHYADVLVKLGSETASSSDEISKGVQKFAAIGNTVGLSYEYAASALATVTATTRESADTVGTSFRTLFSRLQGLNLGQTLEDGTTLNKYSKALNTVGVRIKETNGEMKSMNDILDELGAKWKTLSKDTQIGLAQSIGGARQYSTFMALMDNWDYFQENVDRANNAAGALQKQQDIYAESWAAASKQVQTSMEGIFDSVINDKFVVGATKGFATILDSVKGLTNGLGGLDGMLGVVSNIALTKYAKEIPRIWEDVKYNVGYMFNGKTGYIDEKQRGMFSQSYAGIAEFAKQNEMDFALTTNKFGDNTGIEWSKEGRKGTDLVFSAELKNAAAALQRRQQYLAIEKTLSEREKEEYQQAMRTAAMWDDRAIAAAKSVETSQNQLKDTRGQISQEQYYDLSGTSKEFQRDYKGSRYNLTNAAERDSYYTTRITDLERRRQDEINAVRGNPQLAASSAKLTNNISNIYDKQIRELQAESLSLKESIPESIAEKIKITPVTEDTDAYTRSVMQAIQDPSFGENFGQNFNAAITKVQGGQAITLTERETIQKGLEAFQQPLIKTSENLGRLNWATDRLTGNINKNSNSIIDVTKAQERFGETSNNLKESWAQTVKDFRQSNDLTIKDKKGNVLGLTQAGKDLNEAINSYEKLQAALTNKDGIKESDLFKIVKDFELKSSALGDNLERKAWEKGLTAEQTAAMRQRADQSGRSLEEQKTIEFKQQQEANIQIAHQQKQIEKISSNAQALMSVYSAYQGMQGFWNTWENDNAKASDKIGATLGAGFQMAMLAGQVGKNETLKNIGTKIGGGVLKVGGKVAGLFGKGAATAAAGTAASGAAAAGGTAAAAGGAAAIPGIGVAIAAVLALVAIAPKVADVMDATFETAKEKEERLNREYDTLQQLSQSAKEKQALFEQSNANYLNSVEKFETTELGSIENIRALSEANQQAMSLIKDNNLSIDDYSIDANGLINIRNSALEEAEKTLATQAMEASAKYSISNVSELLRDRKSDYQTYSKYLIGNTETDENGVYLASTQTQQQLEKAKQEALDSGDQELYQEIEQAQLTRQLENNKILSNFNMALASAASSDGTFSKEDQSAIASLVQQTSVEQLQQMQKTLDAKYDKNAFWQTQNSIKDYAIANGVMTKDEINAIIDSQEYKDLRKTDKQQSDQYLIDAVKNQAYLNEYNKLIDQAKKDERKLSKDYNAEAIAGKTMADLAALVEKGGALYEGRNTYGQGYGEEYKYVLAQYNQATTDFYKAIGEYLPDVDFAGALEGFTLEQTQILASSIQEVGEIFGNDAAKAIYDAARNEELTDAEKDHFYAGLENLDLSGSKINSLNNIKEFTQGLGKSFDKTFKNIFKSFGGDAGLFKELTKDNTIQKMVDNFTKLGDIDANSIVQAANSSKDLALALELGSFNSGGLAAALESVASGVLNVGQVTSGLLAGLSHLNQGESVQADAFAVIDGYDKGRSVTDFSKFYANLSKTIEYDLKKGIPFDEPLMNAWEQVFGTQSKNELHQDFMNWKMEGADLSVKFNEKYSREKEYLKKAKKNDGTQSDSWDYAFESTYMEEDDDSQWFNPDENGVDADYQYKTVSNEDVNWAHQILNDPNASAINRDAANAILNQASEETAVTSKYANINGGIYEVTTNPEGEVGKVGWDQSLNDGKGGWTSYEKDAEGNIVATGSVNVDDYIYGWNEQKGTLDFNTLEGRQFTGTKEEFQNINKYVLGMSDGMNDTATADILAHSGVLQSAFQGQGAAETSEALGLMATTAAENGEFITREQLEAMYQTSEYLQGQYTAGPEKFIADVVNSNKEAGTTFASRYLDFSGADMSGKYSDINAQLEKNTGVGTLERLEDLAQTRTILTKTDDYDTKYNWRLGRNEKVANGKETWDESKGAQWQDMQAYNYQDTMDRLLAMGYSQTQANEAMTELLQKGDGEDGQGGMNALVAEVRGIGGNLVTYSTESKAYQDWAKAQGIENAENDAEAFGKFISEQDKVAQAVDAMRIQAEATAKYNELYNPDGTKKETATEEDGGVKPEEEEEKPEENQGQNQGNNNQESTTTDAVYEPPPSTGGDEGDDTGGGGGNPNAGKIAVTYTHKTADGGEYKTTVYKTKEELEEEQNAQAATGKNQKNITKKYASGKKPDMDTYEGIAQVGEEGPELTVDKDGNASILGANGPTYAYVEKDDVIFTADQTKDILSSNPTLSNIPGFDGGKDTYGVGGASSSEHNYNDNIWQGGSGSGSKGGSGGEDEDWEPDRYVVILEQIADLQREYARLAAAKERAYGADKIKALDKEIAKTNELIKAQKAYISEIQQYKEKDIQKMKDLGIDVDKEFQFDRNGVIRNFDEIEEKYKKAAEEGDQEAMKKFEAIQKYMETNNLLEQEADKLIDLEWQKLDEEMSRISTKVDIKVAVDDTELNYLQYQLGKINEEAYDVASALDLVGQQMGVTMNKMNSIRQGIQESIAKGLEGTDLTDEVKKQLEEAIMNGTLTKEMLESMKLDENISQTVMDLTLNYREQLLQLNQALDDLRQQMVDLVDKHFANFAEKMSDQNKLFDTYGQTLQTYYDLVSLLDRKFDGPMNDMLTKINEGLAKQAKDAIKNSEAAVKSAEAKYAEYSRLYNTAIAAGDQDTADKWKDAMEQSYVEMQAANSDFANSLLQANQVFLDQFKSGIATAIEDFEKMISPIFGSVENMSAAFERQNSLSEQYVDDYQKYYELNKMNRDLQTAIDETDNINNKKALAKLQAEINKEKASENKLSEYDLEVLKNKIELEKARLALDEAKNSKSTVTLSRDQNGNWGYIYTAEEDKVAKAEQDYEDKLYQYQESNKKYLDDLQQMAIEAQQNMVSALSDLDVNDPHYEQNRKNIIDSYMSTINYIKEQMGSALGNQESTLELSMDRYSISSLNLKSSFEDLNLSIVAGQKNLDNYFNTLETAVPQLLAQLNQLEEVYDKNIADVTKYVTGDKTLAEYLNENIDIVNAKSEEAVEKISGIYDEMVNGLKDVNEEIGKIYQTYIVPMNEMIAANERLAESIQQVQKELSDLSEVEIPNIEGTIFDHPEGYTENDYGVIRKLTEDEIKKLEEIKKEMQIDANGFITNYDALKEKWYEEAPAEGEEDKRDATKKTYWELLQKLISWKGYTTEKIGNGIYQSKDINEIIASNAAAAQSVANSAIAAALKELNSSFEQNVTIYAEFPDATDQNEIAAAFDNITNDAAQYANRRS